ncbi:glycine cleavage T C-terminal barrel domain-containing protein [Arthrobacter sp. KNU40]|uniref:glycine cleavage T C-terminal barrel domain-containing protein n=1 Tax=Arthrobacter sp. KNU40 TaxID=3447965 RepID=UPI003F635582
MSNPIVNALRAQTPAVHPGWRQSEFSDWQSEQLSWKETCYIGDWSFLWDLEISGPDSLKFFSDFSVNSYKKFDVGQAKHMVMCSSRGKVVGDGILMRLGEEHFRTQAGTATWSSFQLSKGGYDVQCREIQTFQFQVGGPTAMKVCEAATGQDLSDVKFMRFVPVEIAGRKVYALRQGMSGEPGFEFHGDAADTDAVYEAILVAGESHGIKQLGRRTAMINHLEAAFPTITWHYLNDSLGPEGAGFTDHLRQTFDMKGLVPAIRGSLEGSDLLDYCFSPYELGWGKSVVFDHDFCGREALEAERSSGTGKVRVTLEYDAKDVVEIYASLFEDGEPYDYLDIPHPQRWIVWADQVRNVGGTHVGTSTAPGYSQYFRKVLALAFIDPALSEPGTQVEVVWGAPGHRQKIIHATVAPAPYKSDRRRSTPAEASLAPV